MTLCEECGQMEETVPVVIDGEEMDLCDVCAGWWLNHGVEVQAGEMRT